LGDDFRKRCRIVPAKVMKDLTPKENNLNQIVPTKVIEPTGVITPEARDAGFQTFPGQKPQGRFNFSFPKIGGRKLGFAGGGVLVLLIILVLAIGIPLFAVYNSAKNLQASGLEFKAAADSQDLDKINVSLAKLKTDLTGFDRSLLPLVWVRPIPFLGGYWSDANNATEGAIAGVEAGEILLKAIEPYSDILGFNKGKQSEDGAKTAEDRINFIVESIEGVIPELDKVSQKTAIMNEHFAKIDPGRYPETFQDKQVRETIRKGIVAVSQAHELIANGKPVLEQAPYLLGIKKERTYLLLFQNDKELRPTGGFLTAYSILKVKNGKFDSVVSSDIYNLDDRLNSRIPAPLSIKKYLPNVPYWNIRDMNLSPDFKVSMDTFKEHYDKTKSPKVDGIIAVDTSVAVSVLKVIGKIGVPGFGNFSADDDPRCNCPNVVYELEDFADVVGPVVWAADLGGKIVYQPKNADNRKGILGPLMNSLLANSMGQPKEKIPALFEVGFNSLLQKHILFYFGEGEVQAAMDSFNLAGRIREFDGDYLHINDTNFAGAKSNLYVQEEVAFKVDLGRDVTTNTLNIKYKNSQKHDGWLNGVYRDWLRIYVPKGSILIDSTGSEVPIETKEELGKTYFEGFFTLRPLGVIELTFKYTTPVKSKDGYKLLIQKQPGTDGHLYNVDIDGTNEEFYLKTDREIRH